MAAFCDGMTAEGKRSLMTQPREVARERPIGAGPPKNLASR